jgi:hypothetical protein
VHSLPGLSVPLSVPLVFVVAAGTGFARLWRSFFVCGRTLVSRPLEPLKEPRPKRQTEQGNRHYENDDEFCIHFLMLINDVSDFEFE